MARIQNNGNAQTPFKAAGAAFGAFVFWLVVAMVFPYQVLTPYWPDGANWGPIVLFLLAFFNLIRAGNHVRRAVRLKQPNLSIGRMPNVSAAKGGAGRAETADRASRAQARADKDQRRAAALPRITRPPTVQRMR